MHGCRFLMLILALLAPSGRLFAEVLPWALLPLAGIVNLVDGEPKGGLQMEALELLERQMPDVQPTYRAVSRLRQLRDMAEGADFCAAPFFHNAEGEKVGYFIPFTLSTPIQAVMRRDQLPRFALQQGRLPVARVIADTRLRGAVAAGRTYPQEIRALLADASASGRLETVGGQVGGENLLRMIAAGRVDYGFEFATVIRQMNQRPQVDGVLVGVRLEESHALVESGIYCTRSPWGRRMALRLDAAIRQLAAEPEPLLALYPRWLPEETYQAYARELAQAYRARSLQPVQLR